MQQDELDPREEDARGDTPNDAGQNDVGHDGSETAARPIQEPTGADAGSPPSDAEAVLPAPVEEGEPDAEGVPAHTVPATEPGESTQCPRCGTENRPGVAFCKGCGQRLLAAGAPAVVARPAAPEGTQACPRCGTHNRVGVAFCQNCGANLRAAEVASARAAAQPASPAPQAARLGGAVLGPVVLLIGAVGIAVAWLLPFPFGSESSLYDRAFGAGDGYGLAFWTGYQQIDGLAGQVYFGFAAPAPVFVLLLAGLAVAGFVRARPGPIQVIGLAIALAWAIGLAASFMIVELFGGSGGGLIEIMRGLTPGGIIFFLASLIVVIGCLTRFSRS